MTSFQGFPAGFEDSDSEEHEINLALDTDFNVNNDKDKDDYFYIPRNYANTYDHYLEGVKFDCELEEADSSLLDKVYVVFKENNDQESQKMGKALLLSAFEKMKENDFDKNPYAFVLKMILNSYSLDNPGINSLPYNFVTALNDFVRQQDISQQKILQGMITDALREVAFVISYKNMAFFRVTTFVFMLKTPCEPIKARLNEMLAKKDYKTVARVADNLGRWNDFEPEKIIIPLIFRDVMQVAEDFFLKMNSQRQNETLMILDSFLHREYNVENACIEFAEEHSIPNIHLAKLSAKPMIKTITKFLKNANISVEKLPNMNKLVTKNRLVNLLQHRYVDQTRNSNNTDCVIKELVKEDDVNLQEIVIEYCTQNGHLKEAQKWCKWFKIPESKFMSESRLEQLKEYKLKEEENDRKSITTLFLIDKSVKIILVDSSSTYKNMCSVFNRLKFVSIDVEAEPRFNSAVLIQISTTKYIYIVDIKTLKSHHFDQKDWEKMKLSLFDNVNVQKLGFNWNSDKTMLNNAFNWNLETSNGSFLDVQVAWIHLSTNSEFKLPFQYEIGDEKKHLDLKTFVEFCTGTTLDKKARALNFSMRPLTKKMIDYAAKDAHSLLQAYFVLRREGKRCGIDIDLMTVK